MKIRIEMEDALEEDEIIIRCSQLTEEIIRLQRMLQQESNNSGQFILYKEDTEYYVPLTDILFFETESGSVRVHTRAEVYETKYKLYELEEILPGHFLRISKSAIVNCDQIYSVSRNLTASSLIEFRNTHKQIYVSRAYYKVLKSKLDEKRLLK
ncbi:MAG: LytTR family transcriptional regulator [Lachnospiraceae bacterium]|nr:LytTR family transcriptional regulator [Lachnospiraceae bacterium]